MILPTIPCIPHPERDLHQRRSSPAPQRAVRLLSQMSPAHDTKGGDGDRNREFELFTLHAKKSQIRWSGITYMRKEAVIRKSAEIVGGIRAQSVRRRKPSTFALHPPIFHILVCGSYSMDNQYSSCRITCHHCNHAWTYMGIRLAGLGQSNKSVSAPCPRCHTRVKMDARNAV